MHTECLENDGAVLTSAHDNNEVYLKVKTNIKLVKPHKAPEGSIWVFTSKYNIMSIELARGYVYLPGASL